MTRERDNLRKFDYLAVLNLVMIIHDQNPKLIEKELQQNLIKVSLEWHFPFFLIYPIWHGSRDISRGHVIVTGFDYIKLRNYELF